MNTTYITENDKNGKARYYRVTDGKKKVCSKAEYDAHTLVESNDTEAVTADVICEAEENAQIAFEETEVSLTEVQRDFIDISPDEYTATNEKPGEYLSCTLGREIALNIGDNKNKDSQKYHDFYHIIDKKQDTSPDFCVRIDAEEIQHCLNKPVKPSHTQDLILKEIQNYFKFFHNKALL